MNLITNAEGLTIPAYALNQLLNHIDPRDVTAGYIVRDMSALKSLCNELQIIFIHHLHNKIISADLGQLCAKNRHMLIGRNVCKIKLTLKK